MCRLVVAATELDSVSLRYAGSDVCVADLTEAVLLRLASRAGSTWTTRCTVALVRRSEERRVGKVRGVLVPPLSAETKLVPAGTASEIETLRAKEGPLLLTVSV